MSEKAQSLYMKDMEADLARSGETSSEAGINLKAKFQRLHLDKNKALGFEKIESTDYEPTKDEILLKRLDTVFLIHKIRNKLEGAQVRKSWSFMLALTGTPLISLEYVIDASYSHNFRSFYLFCHRHAYTELKFIITDQSRFSSSKKEVMYDGLELWSYTNLLVCLTKLCEFTSELRKLVREKGYRLRTNPISPDVPITDVESASGADIEKQTVKRLRTDTTDPKELQSKTLIVKGDGTIYDMEIVEVMQELAGNTSFSATDQENVAGLIEINAKIESLVERIERRPSTDSQLQDITLLYSLMIYLNESMYNYSDEHFEDRRRRAKLTVEGHTDLHTAKAHADLCTVEAHTARYSQTVTTDFPSDDMLEPQPATTDWIGSLERSNMPGLKEEHVPAELIKLLNEQCMKYEIKNPSWSRSVTDSKTIHIFGEGLGTEEEALIRKEVSKTFPKFTIQFTNNALPTEQLSGTLHQRQYDGKWITCKKATCELIVSGQRIAQERRGLFAITCAHLLLTDEECIRIMHNPTDQNGELQRLRGDVNARIGTHSYKLTGPQENTNLNIQLGNPTAIAYRQFPSNAEPDQPKAYFSDIAALPIESFSEDILRNQGITHQTCKITNIRVLDRGDIAKMVEFSAYVYVREKCGIVVAGRETFNQNQPLALRLTFKLENGQFLEPGDSGSVVYIKSGLEQSYRRVALAIVNGERRDQAGLYEAVPLEQALRDLHQDHPHLIGNLSLFTNTRTAGGARPPNT